jgi:glyoxylase-like metal-dependent hydrolase (beta-lactamase superfamily II)
MARFAEQNHGTALGRHGPWGDTRPVFLSVCVAPSLTPPETPVQVVIDVGGALTSVTPFFSGHCPGSAAFLFHNDEMGRVLHTGDWRLEDLCVLLLSHETSLS